MNRDLLYFWCSICGTSHDGQKGPIPEDCVHAFVLEIKQLLAEQDTQMVEEREWIKRAYGDVL